MSRSDDETAPFKTVDWDRHGGRSRRPGGRTLVLLAGAAGLAASFAHDYLFAPEKPYPFSLVGWDVSRLDWLLLVAVLVGVRYGLVPALANRDRAARRARALLGRPAGLLSVVGIVGLTLTAFLGPDSFELLYPRLEHRLQPPVYTTTSTEIDYNYQCVGRVVEGRCHGSWRYPLGTNRIGENVLELVAEGLHVAMKLGVAAGVIMVVLGVVVGATAGYVGGRVDDLLMRYVDVQQTVPAVIVYVLVASLFLGEYGGIPDGGLFTLAVVFGLLDWGGVARLVRSQALQLRTTGYVRAARAAGASRLWVLRNHVVPNTTSTALTAVTRRIPLLVLAQVALAYLELNQVSASFGRTMRAGLFGDAAWHEKWWVTTAAVVVLVVLVVSFSVFGDVLRDVLDPQTEVE